MYCSSFAASRSALRFTYSHMMWYKNHKFHFEYLPKPWNVIRNVTVWAHTYYKCLCSFVWQCFARSCSIFAKLFSFHSAVCDTHSTRDSKHKNISYPIAENKPQKQFTFSSEKVHARWKGNRIHFRIVSLIRLTDTSANFTCQLLLLLFFVVLKFSFVREKCVCQPTRVWIGVYLILLFFSLWTILRKLVDGEADAKIHWVNKHDRVSLLFRNG